MRSLGGQAFWPFGSMPVNAGPGAVAKTMPVILQRAAGRGEVDLNRITPRVAMLPFDLFRHEVLTSSEPVPAATVTEIVDDVFLPLIRA
jgi:hypothetical protein